MRGQAFDVADTFLVRAAAWPLEDLLAFDAGPVERLSSTTREAERDAIYDALVEEDRKRLYARTCESESFLRALTLSNPELALRARQLRTRPARNKRVRHLETTLLRHLCRAAARPTPCGLWAGVAAGTLTDRDSLEPAAPAIRCEPELKPLVELFDAVIARDRSARRYVLNPTAYVQAGHIHYTVNGEHCAVHWPEFAATVVEALRERGCAALSELEAALRSVLPDGDLDGLLEQLATYRLIECTDGFPQRFASAWEALEKAAERLPNDAQATWRGCIAELAEHCGAIEERFASDSAEELAERCRKVQALLTATAHTLGVAVAIPRVPLRVDLALGLRVSLGGQSAAKLRDAVREYLVYQSEVAPGPALRELTFATLESALEGADGVTSPPALEPFRREPGRTTTWDELSDCVAVDGSLRARLGRLRELLDSDLPTVAVPLGNLSDAAIGKTVTQGAALVIGIDMNERRALIREFHALAPHPYTLYGRFAGLLGRTAAAEDLGSWLTRRLRSANGDTMAVELVAPFVAPNLLAHPASGLPLLAPWEPERSHVKVADLCVRRGRLTHAATGRPLAIHWLSAADLRDPVTELLTATSGNPLRALRFEAAAVPLRVESKRPRTPELTLPSGVRIRPARSVLEQQVLQELYAAPSKRRRFERWLQVAQERAWPALVRVRVPGKASLVIPTRSPLAIETLFEGLEFATCPRMIVEVFSPDTCLRLSTGTHVAEFVFFIGTTESVNPKEPA